MILDRNGDPRRSPVRFASIPNGAVEYDHIHFGVWAGLSDNEDGDNSVFADLGIGFVQNHRWLWRDHEARHLVPPPTTATGLLSVRSDALDLAGAGAKVGDGAADLTANFSTDEFTADLDGPRHAGRHAFRQRVLGHDGATVDHTPTAGRPATSRASSAATSTVRKARRPLASSTSTATMPARSAVPSAAGTTVVGPDHLSFRLAYRRPVRQRVGRLFLTPSRRNSHAS